MSDPLEYARIERERKLNQRLPGARLSKPRHRLAWHGLLLLEVEAESEPELRALAPQILRRARELVGGA